MKIHLNRDPGTKESSSTSTLKTLASSAGAGLATAGVNQLFANFNRSKDVAAQKELQEHSQALAQLAQRDSAANLAEGYRKAGLSTALLAGSNFSPAIGSVPGTPQKNVSVGFPITEMAQLGLISAQKANLEAETEAKQIQNQRMKDTLSVGASAAQTFIQSMLDDKTFSLANRDTATLLLSLKESLAEHPNVMPEDLEKIFKNKNLTSKYDSEQFSQVYQKALDFARLAFKSGDGVPLANILAEVDGKRLEQVVTGLASVEAGTELSKQEKQNLIKSIDLIGQQTRQAKSAADLNNSENIDKLFKQLDTETGGLNAEAKFILKLLAIIATGLSH